MDKVELRKILVAAICEALPYNPILSNPYINNGLAQRVHPGYLGLSNYIDGHSVENTTFDYTIDTTKILIRPMSDMTKEEEKELYSIYNKWFLKGGSFYMYTDVIDWFNKHHFDYRGLIELGIGLPVTRETYNL